MGFLELKNANYGYDKSFHLSDVSFSIAKGQFSGIIGPNGSGKSTLLKGITGEIAVSQGQIFLNRTDLGQLPNKERSKKIAVVTQFTGFVDMTVEEYVLTGRIPYRRKYQFFESAKDFEIAFKYMELTDVVHLRNKKFSELSGGEQQLVSVAKALAQEPTLLLLDEPTSHLDISHQVQVLNLIQLLSHDLELTVMMVIHDLNLASEYCDYLVLMKDGHVFQHSTPKEILTYKNIEEVYNTVVITQDNPISGKPSVFLISNKILTGTGNSSNI
jgi:iron complex transport system ATP-binding protein